MLASLTFTATLWQWEARRDTWWFVSIPADVAAEITDLPLPPRGFGSVRVAVTIGSTSWKTSVFPDKDGTYSLPIKKAVRNAEGLDENTPVAVRVDVIGS